MEPLTPTSSSGLSFGSISSQPQGTAFPFLTVSQLSGSQQQMSNSTTSQTLIGSYQNELSSPHLGLASHNPRASYKDRRKTYQIAKKKVAEELLSTIGDPTVVVLADWLKVRGTLKGWTKIWCELKPGLLIIYKTPKTHKSGSWVGTVLLNVCEVIERPSKKDGFCFKLFHPLQESIWASKVRR